MPEHFAERQRILDLTAGVVLFTLLVQGTTVSRLIRASNRHQAATRSPTPDPVAGNDPPVPRKGMAGTGDWADSLTEMDVDVGQTAAGALQPALAFCC